MGLSRTILFEKITQVADTIRSVDPRELQSGQIGKEAAEAILEQCDICITQIAAAQSAGAEGTEKIVLSVFGRNDPRMMSLIELQRWCRELAALAREGLYRVRIQQALLQASVWVGELDEPEGLSEDQAILAAETGHYLLQVLRDAQGAGVPDSMPVVWNATPITLAAATQLADYVATTAIRRQQSLATRHNTTQSI